MNKFLRFYDLIKYTNNSYKFFFLIFLSFFSNFAEMFGLVMVIPLTLTFLEGEKALDVQFLDVIVDLIINNAFGFEPLVLILAIIAIIFILKLFLLSYTSYKIFSLVQNIGEQIANKTFLKELNQKYIDQYREGSSIKIRRTLYDTLKVSAAMSGLIMVISEIFLFFLVIILFLSINTKLFYSVFIIFFIALFYAKISKKFIYNSSLIQQKKYSDWLKFLQESFGGIKMIKLNNSESFFSNIHAKQTKAYFAEEKKLNFVYIVPKTFYGFFHNYYRVLICAYLQFLHN